MLLNGLLNLSLNRSSAAGYKNQNIDNPADNKNSLKQVYDELKEKMKDVLDSTSSMSDEEKAEYEERINRKIKNGEKLSGTEMRYLQINNPYMYTMVSRVQFQRQALEDKLKNCKSKEEVEEAYTFSVTHISKDDPAKEPLLAAYNNVTEEFKKSMQYKSLPQKADDKDEKDKIPVSGNSKTKESDIERKYLLEEDDFSPFDMKA